MSISYLPDLAARVKAVALEAVASLKSPMGAVDFPDTTGDYPYFSLRLGGFTDFEAEDNYNTEDWSRDLRTLTLFLVMGKLTEGYKGETVGKIYQYEELLIQQFKSENGQQLISATYPSAATYLTAEGVTFSTGTGLVTIQMGGTGQTLLASTYTVLAPCVALLN